MRTKKRKKDRERHLATWRARRARTSKQEVEEDLIVKRMEKRKQREAKKVEAKRQDSATEVPGPSPFPSRQAQGKAMKKKNSSGPFIDAQIREANMDVNYEQSPPEDLLTLAN
ncbi:hypothetical protein CAPTEDRAFT_188805, partial [Capitella teleta]